MKRIIIIACSIMLFMFTGSFNTVSAGCNDCDLQSEPFAVEQSGIKIKGNANEWLSKASADARYLVTIRPAVGRVMVLMPQNGIPSLGHVLYVSKSIKRGDRKYRLRLSHSNFDCRCSQELNVQARYNRVRKTVKFITGQWAGETFKVAGFVGKNN